MLMIVSRTFHKNSKGSGRQIQTFIIINLYF